MCCDGNINKLPFLMGPDGPVILHSAQNSQGYNSPRCTYSSRTAYCKRLRLQSPTKLQVKDYRLNLSQRHASYVKDTCDFTAKAGGCNIAQGTPLFSMDVAALYPNISKHQHPCQFGHEGVVGGNAVVFRCIATQQFNIKTLAS